MSLIVELEAGQWLCGAPSAFVLERFKRTFAWILGDESAVSGNRIRGAVAKHR